MPIKTDLERLLSHEYISEMRECFDIDYFSNLIVSKYNISRKHVSSLLEEGAKNTYRLKVHLKSVRKIDPKKLNKPMTI